MHNHHHEKNPAWKGSKAGYKAIHEWLRRNYGSADHCDMINCEHICKFFQYALKKGFKHSHNINAYMQLCNSCHKNYDMNDQTRKNISDGKKGKRVYWKNPKMVMEKLKEHAKTRSRNLRGVFIKEN